MAGSKQAIKTRPAPHEIPSSLFTQIFALVLATVAVAQIVNLLLFFMVPADRPIAIPLDQLANAIEQQNNSLLSFNAVPAAPALIGADNPVSRRLALDLAARLERAPEDVVLAITDVQGNKFVEIHEEGVARPQPAILGPFIVGLREEKGWTLIELRDQGLFSTREQRFMLLFLASAFAMLPIAWIFARRLARPFEQFADAAETLGRDPRAAPPLMEGSAEVERASDAFRRMQKQLQEYVSNRTQMLGAIAHDLRTPLTRLAFRLEAIDPPLRDKMQNDVAEMDAMIRTTLELARLESEPGNRKRLELGSLLEKVADDLALTGRRVTAQADAQLIVSGDALGLRRAISNLLENGETYGGKAYARAWRDGDLAIIDVEDEGPGLPPGEEERVFEPFYRLERSRSRETGGTGLGLAVVRSIVRAHGGDVKMENRPEGGLRARLTLPLARTESASS